MKILTPGVQGGHTLKWYLETGKYKNVLLVFRHGLGDAVMFYNECLVGLQAAFPQVKFTFDSMNCGQETLFGKVDGDTAHYDLAVKFDFPCSEWGAKEITKGGKCAVEEIGMEFQRRTWTLPKKFANPLVGVHFCSTCMPSRLGVPKTFAYVLWNLLSEYGFLPLDTHMEHANHNSKNVPFDWAQPNLRKCRADIGILAGTIGRCAGFAGCGSGNFLLACSILPPEKILFLKTEFNASRLTRMPVHQIDARSPKFDYAAFDKWVADVRKN